MLFITDCITSCCKFETYSSCDITGVNLIQLFSLVGMHLKDTTNTFFLALCCVQCVRTGIQSTGIYTEECQLTNEWVCHNLECKSGERFFIRRMSDNIVAIHINTLDWWDV